MKKIIKNLFYGLLVSAGALLASCSTTDEVMDTIPYNRVLTPQKFSASIVSSSGTDVILSWNNVSNAEAYTLEIFEAVELEPNEDGKTVYSVNPADYEEAVPVYSNEELTGSDNPVTVGLDVDVTYFARVRGTSTKVDNSGWVYLEKVFSTYPVRPALNPAVVTRTSSAVTIGWDYEESSWEDLSYLEVDTVIPVDGVEPMELSFTDEEKSNQTKTVEGLDSATEYKFTLIFGKGGQRGTVTAWTRPVYGAGIIEVSSPEAIVNAVKGATGKVELLVKYNDGADYNFAKVLNVPTDDNPDAVGPFSVACELYIYGEASDSGKKPVISNVAFELADGAALHLEDLALDGKKTIGATVGYVEKLAGNVAFVEFVNCEFYDYTKGLYSVADGQPVNVGALTLKGVYAHDINADGTVGGDFIDIRDGDYGDITLENSTFSFCARTFLRVSENKTKKVGNVLVANCTFNAVTATTGSGNNSGIFHFRYSGAQSDATKGKLEMPSFKLENCVFLNERHDKEGTSPYVRLTRDSNENIAPTCANNYYYNVGDAWFPTKSVNLSGEPFSQALAMADGGVILDADPCVNSEAGKLYLTNGVISANHVGDPRWWNAAEPKIERATELVTVTEPTVWDFTAKAKFDGEVLEQNTIIENIRIYAPAEILLGEGVAFPAAAKVDGQGRPTSSALGFRVSGVGSVKVTTLDGGYNATVTVVADGDRYTLPADGKEHTVVLGDLVGENDIYILAGSALTVISVEWSDNLTPDATKIVLATPKVSFAPANVIEGNEDMVDVVASWAAIENAYDYVVTFNNQTVETTETSYTIAAADVAALRVGDYEISVVARPVATSSKYSESEAGVAKFTVKEKPAAGAPVTLVWDFSTAEWQAAFEAQAPAAKGSNAGDWSVTLNGLTYTSGSGNGKWDASGFIQPNGAGNPDDSKLSRVFSFNAPANGTLKVTAATASSGNARAVNVKDAKETQTQDVDAKEDLIFDVVAGDVRIYPGGGIRFYKFEFTYIDPNAVAAEPVVWNFAEVSWLADFMETIKLTNDRDFNYDTGEGLFLINGGGGGIKNNTAGDGFIDTNGSNTKGPKQLRFEFEVPAGKWNVAVWAKKNSAGDAGTLQLGLGDWSDDASVAAAEQKINTPAELDWASFETVTVSEPTKVYIYAYYRTQFYGLKYEPAE